MAAPQPQPPPLAGIHPHACLPPSRSTPPYYSPQITFCGVACPTAYMEAQFPIPTAVQQLECHLLKKQEESRRALPTIVKKSQEVFSQLTPDSWASQTHKSVSSGPGDIINLELWEQHRRTSFTQHQGTLPSGNQPSLGRVQPQGKFPGAGRAKEEQGSSQPSAFAGGSSQDIQDMESQGPEVFQIRKSPSLDLGYCPGSDSDLFLNSDSSLVVLPGASSEEEAESDWMKASSDTRNDLPGSPDTEHGQDILKVHLSRKLGQIKEGRIPVSVRHSRLATDQALAPSENSNPHKETRTLTSSEGWESYKDTSQELLPDPGNKHVLEAHVRRLWVRHRWGLLLKILKMKNLFMLRKAQPPPLPLSTFPSWATCEFGDNSTAEFVNFLGEDPWAEETKEPVEAEEEKPPAWKATLGASVRTDSHTFNLDLSSGSLRNSKSSQPSIISVTQDPEELCLNATIVSECELAVEVEPEKQPQGPAPDVLLQDRTTGVILEDCDPDILQAADMWAFQTTVSSSHSKSSAGTRGPCESQSKQSGPTDKRERCQRPKPGGHKQRSARPRTSQTSGISQPSQDRVLAESLRTKSSQLLPNEGQAPTGSRFGNKTRQFLQWIFPKKNTGQEEPRQNCKPASATVQCSGPVTGRSFMDTKTDEVQELVTNVGQILEEEIGPNHELLPSKGNWYKEELQATGGGHCSYHRGPSHPEQRRVMSDPACSHQATPMGRSSSVKNRCVQDKNNNQGPPARPCQHQPRVARASSHPVHCPRHCCLRRGVLPGQPDHTSPTFPGQQTFFSEVQFRQRK
ncbi:spermatogenesis-associated protein 31E1-like [Lemur catta]|uniref:spermatogenesis-associated protein 31E1-like n=1 Tax=Lemur catta TaxID=9447 RepID=UPI001E267156|nr:spermatogenesis-associated protein 31E1-like [Lemur catta]